MKNSKKTVRVQILKYSFILTSFITLCSIFTSCETLNKIGDTFSQIGKGTKNAFSKTLQIPKNYDKAYSYRTNIPDKTIQNFIKTKEVESLRQKNPSGYIKSICKKIHETSSNDFEKVKMAHDAVCLLVHYDAQSFWTGNIPDQEWATVVKNGLAVCEGYSNLFLKYMTELKIPCYKVHGYARGVGTNVFEENPKDSNHAWNIVQIEDEWYQIDSTWDSGHMEGRTSIQKYNTEWLFVKPEHCIYSHFPTVAKYQLITPPLSAEDFSNLPDFRPVLFEIASDGFSNIRKINIVSSSFELNYKLKNDYRLSFHIMDNANNEVSNRIYTEKNNDILSTKFTFPAKGRYMIRIFYYRDGKNHGLSCGNFTIEANDSSNIEYPDMNQEIDINAILISPKYSPLVAGEVVHFEITNSEKEYCAVIIGNDFHFLEKDENGNFIGDIEVPHGTKNVKLSLAKSKNSGYYPLATYKVKDTN